MTTDLEKQFFDTFGIEPKTNQVYGIQLDYHIEDYPQITDTHYLQLICELSGVCCPHFAFERDISELKEVILKFCIYYKDQLEKSVQALFKEER